MSKYLSKNRSYWKDVVFQASGNTVAQVIGIAGMPILTRLYAPETFAIQAVFIQIVALLTAFITFRFEYFLQLVGDIKESYSLIRFVLSVGFWMMIFLTFVFFVLDIIGFFKYFNILMSNYFYFAPITAYFICISIVFQHEAQRQEDFKSTAVAEVSSKIGYISIGAMLAIFTNGIGLILTTIAGSVAKLISLRKYVCFFLYSYKEIKINKYLISIYKARSIGMIVSNTILTCSGLLPILFISKQYNTDILGQFSLVMATVFLPSGLIGRAVGNVFYQRSAKLWNMNDFEGFKEIWTETFIKLLVFALPIYLFIYFVSSWAYPFAFGEQWLVAGKIAELMSIAAFFSFLAGPLDRMSLVLGIGFYLPLIHFFRLIVVLLGIYLAVFFDFKSYEFFLFYSSSMAFIYMIDIIVSRFYLLNRKINMQI